MDNISLTGVSDIVAVSSTVFLTIERDGLYGGNTSSPATFKKIFKIDLSNATDISDALMVQLENVMVVKQWKNLIIW